MHSILHRGTVGGDGTMRVGLGEVASYVGFTHLIECLYLVTLIE